MRYSYHFFDYGKNRAGWWDGEKMARQAVELIDVAEFLYPGHQFVFLFDWSSCHDKMPTGSFNVSKFKTVPGFQFTKPKKGALKQDGTPLLPEQKPFIVSDMELKCEYPEKPTSITFTYNIQHVKFQPGERPHFNPKPIPYNGFKGTDSNSMGTGIVAGRHGS